VALILAAPFAVLGGALAFYRVNDRPLVVVLEHAFNYAWGHKLYLWKHREPSTAAALQEMQAKPRTRQPEALMPIPPKFSESKLKDLAWSLNIKDRLAEEEQDSH
jgi:hypothetical protein